MAKRKAISARTSRKIFRKGTKVNKKNSLAGATGMGVMRGGIRF